MFYTVLGIIEFYCPEDLGDHLICFQQHTLAVYLWICLSHSAIDILLCATLGEGNGNPLQYSCLENPMDRGT